MRLKDEFEIRECYETEPGCPTLTIVLPDKETMVPWSQFSGGELLEEKISLHFGPSFYLHIHGTELEELWRVLQMQDLRRIRPSEESDNGSCQVSALTIEVPTEANDEVEMPF